MFLEEETGKRMRRHIMGRGTRRCQVPRTPTHLVCAGAWQGGWCGWNRDREGEFQEEQNKRLKV